MLNESGPLRKIIKIGFILVVIFYIVKWFVYSPFMGWQMSKDYTEIDYQTFYKKALEIGADNIFTIGPAKQLAPDEKIQRNGYWPSPAVTLTTLGKTYSHDYTSPAPSNVTCIYKVENGVRTLLKFPENCKFGSSYNAVASNKVPYLMVYFSTLTSGNIYIFQDDGKVLVYKQK